MTYGDKARRENSERDRSLYSFILCCQMAKEPHLSDICLPKQIIGIGGEISKGGRLRNLVISECLC